jgi:hypothetical protein
MKRTSDLYAVSLLLQKGPDDGSIVSHTLHWTTALDHGEAIKFAIAGTKKMKPDLVVVGVLCANTRTGEASQSYNGDGPGPR